MKPLGRQPQLQNRHVGGQDGVQRPVQIGQSVSPLDLKGDDLSLGVNPPVGAPRADDPRLAVPVTASRARSISP